MTSLYPFVVNRRVRVRDRRDGDDGRVSLSIEIEAVRMRMRKENAAPLSWTELASHSSRMVFLSENMITRENNKYKNKECKREAEAIESETHSSLDVSLSLFTDYTFFFEHYGHALWGAASSTSCDIGRGEGADKRFAPRCGRRQLSPHMPHATA